MKLKLPHKKQSVLPKSFVVFALGISLLFGGNLFADDLQDRYLKLRNTDPQLKKIAEWKSVAGQLLALGQKKKDGTKLYAAAIAYGHLSTIAPENKELHRQALEKLYTLCPEHERADDALVTLCEENLQGGNREEAVALCEKVIKEYPISDSVLKAKVLLGQEEVVVQDRVGDQEGSPEQGPVDVVLDPGHGGEDLGAVGSGGVYEKDIVLSVAYSTQEILEQKYGRTSLLTRTGDEFVPLLRRSSVANEVKAKIFVSLHVNASVTKKARGFEVYYLDNTDDAKGKLLADRENAAFEGDSPPALQSIIGDLIQGAKLEDSIELAQSIDHGVMAQVKGLSLHSLGSKRAPFYVLVGSHMPSVLAELFFVDHPEEGALLADRSFRAKLAQGLAQGIDTFLKTKTGK